MSSLSTKAYTFDKSFVMFIFLPNSKLLTSPLAFVNSGNDGIVYNSLKYSPLSLSLVGCFS